MPSTSYARDQFLSDAKALTSDDHYALAANPGMFYANAWALADGVPAVTDNGELDLTNPAFVEQIQSYFDLAAVEKVARPPSSGDAPDQANQEFLNGNVDMLIEGPWNYGTFAEAADFDLGITIVPSTSGAAAAMTAGSGFGISTTCDRPDEAFEAIVALTSQPVQEQQAAARGIVPSISEALPAWSKGKPEAAGEVISASLENATAQIATPTWNQVETLMTQYSPQGFRGELDAAEMMETITASAASAG